jgi:hypothetical protein
LAKNDNWQFSTACRIFFRRFLLGPVGEDAADPAVLSLSGDPRKGPERIASGALWPRQPLVYDRR